jgi:ribosomal protein S18 acetylase RimI-like enzyme
MIILQQVTAEDEQFLYEVYVQTRAEEMGVMGWNQEQGEAFLRMQFDMQKRSYAMQYPKAEHRIVLLDGVPIGRIMIDFAEEALLLVDVSLLSRHHNLGIGTRLIRDLQQAAESGRAVRLHVLNSNPAQRLYARLGFQVTGEKFPYLAMEWQPL